MGRFADGPDQVAFAGEGEVRADPEQRRYRGALEQRPGVEVDPVLEPGIAGGVGRRHVVEPQRAAVGKDDPLPHDQRAALAERDHAVVLADQTGALRNERNPARGAVVDALGDLRDHQPRKVRTQPGDQARGDHAPGQKWRQCRSGLPEVRLRPADQQSRASARRGEAQRGQEAERLAAFAGA